MSLNTDPVVITRVIRKLLMTQFLETEKKASKKKGLRSDIFATQVIRAIYKIPLFLIKGTKDHKFARLQQYKSGQYKDFFKSFNCAFDAAV